MHKKRNNILKENFTKNIIIPEVGNINIENINLTHVKGVNTDFLIMLSVQFDYFDYKDKVLYKIFDLLKKELEGIPTFSFIATIHIKNYELDKWDCFMYYDVSSIFSNWIELSSPELEEHADVFWSEKISEIDKRMHDNGIF